MNTTDTDTDTDTIRDQVMRELPYPKGGFETADQLADWKHKTEARFMALVMQPETASSGKLLATFKEFMTFDDLNALVRVGTLELVTMRINDWFVKGQYATFVSHADGKQFPTCNYVCIESGKGESLWQFNKELFYQPHHNEQ